MNIADYSMQEACWWPFDDDEQSYSSNSSHSVSQDALSPINQPITSSFSNETDDIVNKIVVSSSTNASKKQKIANYDDLLWADTIEAHLLSPTFDINKIFDEPEEHAKCDDEKIPIFDEESVISIDIDIYLPEGIGGGEFQDQDDLKLEMKLEVDLPERFRARTSSDFKPKKNQTRKGTPSIPRPPRYFNAGGPRQYLKLLIPKAFLSTSYTWLEICIVTPDINGYTYVNPYFQFQIHPTDPHAPNLNPIYMIIDDTTDLKPSVDDQYVQLKLKLVVVKLTNNELMEVEQPLKIFSTPTNDFSQAPITVKYEKRQEFKEAFHLQEIRFAFTLWKKEPGETECHRCIDTQYISSISIEDKNVKKNDI